MSLTPKYKTVPIDRDLIPSLGEARAQVLWIGCSDSSAEEVASLNLLPEESIVLRNIGNMFLDDDPTCLSMAQYAINMLEVSHVVVCGHYGCGLVKASTDAGLSDPWRSKLDALRSACGRELGGSTEEDRDRAFVEQNVLAQMRTLPDVPEVAAAMASRGLKIHGVVYDLRTNEAVKLEVQQ